MRRTLAHALLTALALAAQLPYGSAVLAGTAVRMEPADLARRADLILAGRVLSARAVLDPSGRIDTEYRLRVERTFWGEPLAVRTLRIPGGVLPDGRGMLVPGLPGLAVGEELVLFLSPEGPSGLRMPTGLAQGKLTVLTDRAGRKTLVRSHGALQLADPRTGALRDADATLRFDYAAFLAELEAALSVRRAEER